MNEVSNIVKADKIIRWGMTFSFVLLLLQAGILALFFLKLPPVMPLFNQLPWGESRLGATYEFLLPLVISSVFFLFNYVLLRKLYITMPLVSRIIGITTLLASSLSFIFVVRTLELIL
jgi:hypothetical protein